MLYQAVRPKARMEEVIDYQRLPAPVKYEELQRENLSEQSAWFSYAAASPACLPEVSESAWYQG